MDATLDRKVPVLYATEDEALEGCRQHPGAVPVRISLVFDWPDMIDLELPE